MCDTDKNFSEADTTHIDFKEKIRSAPEKPGVYFWKDTAGKILYIGKAKRLKNRVRSYFYSESKGRRIDRMVGLARNLDWIVTSSEAEALILEDHLIKIHKPKFNIRQKDNKSYPYIKLTKKEPFPRLFLTRELEDKTAVYFGPYKSAFDARKTLATIHKYFPLRKKNIVIDGEKIHRPCLNFHLNRCLAPCAGKVTSDEYGEIVAHVVKLLKGEYKTLTALLGEKMENKSARLQFEDAAKIRDQIKAVSDTLRKQRVVGTNRTSRDVIYIHQTMGLTAVQFLFVRNGMVLSGDFFTFKTNTDVHVDEITRHIVSKMYVSGKIIIPEELIVSKPSESMDMLVTYVRERQKKELKIYTPTQGERKALLNLCKENLEENLMLQIKKEETHEYILKQTRQELHLKNIPVRIECFDVSNISGTSTVASMTVFEHNRPLKSGYRRFKIKTVKGSNDFLAMSEVIGRRMKRMLSDDRTLPNLMVIDGGMGQLNVVTSVLKDYDIGDMDVIAIAKGRTEKRNTPGGTLDSEYDTDYVFKPNQKNPIRLKKNSPGAHVIRNIRDEAHRFAIEYHRNVRRKHSLGRILTGIKGIGKVKQQRLLKHFGGLTKLRDASTEEILSVKGINRNDPEKIYAYFEKMSH